MRECRYDFMRWTKVVFPEPAMPMVMITTGFLVGYELVEAGNDEVMIGMQEADFESSLVWLPFTILS